jgi:hypothetical protein
MARVVRAEPDRRSRALVQAVGWAIWLVVYRFLVRPLLPSGDILGIAILVVLSLGILAVPIVAAFTAGSGEAQAPGVEAWLESELCGVLERRAARSRDPITHRAVAGRPNSAPS